MVKLLAPGSVLALDVPILCSVSLPHIHAAFSITIATCLTIKRMAFQDVGKRWPFYLFQRHHHNNSNPHSWMVWSNYAEKMVII